MNKRWVLGVVSSVLLVVVVLFALVAATLGSEASKMDAMLKADMTQRMDEDAVRKQLTDAGYTIQGDAPTLKAAGPKHSLIVYTVWLTLDLTFDPSGVLISYHLDRAG